MKTAIRTRPCIRSTRIAALLLCVGVLDIACSVDSAKNRYVLAEKLWTDKKYAASVTEFEKVRVKDPKGKLGQRALYRSAMTQMLFLSQYEEAERKFRQLIEISTDPDTQWDAQKQVGEILFSKTEHYDEAIQHYEGLIKQRPDATEAPEFIFRMAKARFYLWRFDEAIRSYNEILKKHPTPPWAEKAAFEIGITYFTRGEQRPGGRGPGMESYQEAIDAYGRFIKNYPKSELLPQAQFGIASCLEELDQLDAAFHAYESLLSTYPSPRVIQIKLARIRERKAQRSH